MFCDFISSDTLSLDSKLAFTLPGQVKGSSGMCFSSFLSGEKKNPAMPSTGECFVLCVKDPDSPCPSVTEILPDIHVTRAAATLR